MKLKRSLSIFMLMFLIAITNKSNAQIRDSLLLKNLTKVLKVRPEKLDVLLHSTNKGKAFIFSIVIAVNSAGKIDYVKYSSTPEISDFFEYSDYENRIKDIKLMRYKNRKIWIPFLLKNMDDDIIKNGLHREFDTQWNQLIPSGLDKIAPDRKLILFMPEIYSYKSLEPKIIN